MESLQDAISLLRIVPDFPNKGVSFVDISMLLKNHKVFELCIGKLADKLPMVDYVVGIEARGFIIGTALAHQLGAGFIPIRKKGKLPSESIGIDYKTEYSTASIEMHKDAMQKGDSVIITDDVLATGGTAQASAALVSKLGANIEGFAFLIELPALKGREHLNGAKIKSLISFENGKLLLQ